MLSEFTRASKFTSQSRACSRTAHMGLRPSVCAILLDKLAAGVLLSLGREVAIQACSDAQSFSHLPSTLTALARSISPQPPHPYHLLRPHPHPELSLRPIPLKRIAGGL